MSPHLHLISQEISAQQSDMRFADQEHRRNNDLLLSDNFERRIRELEEPVRDLKSVCEQRVIESRDLASVILPDATSAARADLAQVDVSSSKYLVVLNN